MTYATPTPYPYDMHESTQKKNKTKTKQKTKGLPLQDQREWYNFFFSRPFCASFRTHDQHQGATRSLFRPSVHGLASPPTSSPSTMSSFLRAVCSSSTSSLISPSSSNSSASRSCRLSLLACPLILGLDWFLAARVSAFAARS